MRGLEALRVPVPARIPEPIACRRRQARHAQAKAGILAWMPLSRLRVTEAICRVDDAEITR
jgi:hypothetical protein